MKTRHKVKVRRAYEEPTSGDAARVLVVRIWPRGPSNEAADLDEWCQEVAPSTALRKCYGHVPERFSEFDRRYRVELREPERAEAVLHLRDLLENGSVTLLTATKHAEISEAAVLAEMLGT